MDFTTYLSYKPEVQAFFDVSTNTITYIVADAEKKECVIIDSVLDYNPENKTVSHESADAVIAYVREKSYRVTWILETHVHADHLSAAFYLREKLGGKIAINTHITDVQEVFGEMFGEGVEFKRDGSQFDRLLTDGDTSTVGTIPAYALHTPGHTPADMVFIIGDSVFAGDTMFMPDYGTARCDFPGGSAETMYSSIQKIFTLPPTMRMFMCHDYLPQGRTKYIWETTVGEQKESNIHLKAGTDMHRFVAMRKERDATLGMPKLIIPSIQVNMKAGAYSRDPATGTVHIKEPVKPLDTRRKQ